MILYYTIQYCTSLVVCSFILKLIDLIFLPVKVRDSKKVPPWQRNRKRRRRRRRGGRVTDVSTRTCVTC